MAQNNSFFEDLKKELIQFRQALTDGWHQLRISLRNQIRLARRQKMDFIVMPIGGPLPERSAPPRSFIERQLPLPSPPLSMQSINRRLQTIADAGNVQGVVFVFEGFTTGLARLQSLRRSMQRLREAGKKVIVFTPFLDMPHYFVATAADLIVAPPSTEFNAVGLRTETVFLKDALERIGVQADFVQISPYKTAGNPFTKSEVTPEQQAQMAWLLEDSYDLMTGAMAEGRGRNQADIQHLIDQAPFFAHVACEHHLIDHVAYQDDLPYLLAELAGRQPTAAPRSTAEEPEPAENPESASSDETEPRSPVDAQEQERTARPKAKLRSWAQASDLLLEKHRRIHRKSIGVISLEGSITMGDSEQPPIDFPLPFIGGLTAGERTLLQQLRYFEQRTDMAALILHVDSPGGSALASDLIWREVHRISHKKPVVAYMGNVAASGGYYVSAAAGRIIAQTGTITGSIGVLGGRLSTAGLFRKLSVNRFSLSQGAHADIYSNEEPMTPDEYQIFWNSIVEVYRQFKHVVAEGRNIEFEELDPICEGRVWTGRQAEQRQLVDSHGDFIDAVREACDLAELPTADNIRVLAINIYPKGRAYRLPRPYPEEDQVAGLAGHVARLLTGERLRHFQSTPLLLMPYEIRFW